VITDGRDSRTASLAEAQVASQDGARGGLPGGGAVELANGISPALAIELLALQFIVSGVRSAIPAGGGRSTFRTRSKRSPRHAVSCGPYRPALRFHASRIEIGQKCPIW